MELRHLRYFIAVAEELNFRRAAERLYVAQPAVSEQVRKLEDELGVRLLERSQRKVSLTDAGTALLSEARRVLHEVEMARVTVQNARDRAVSQLRIGYTPASLPARISRALRRLSAELANAVTSLEPTDGRT
jgi:DNA-binding transcriptional LysR family regulator